MFGKLIAGILGGLMAMSAVLGGIWAVRQTMVETQLAEAASSVQASIAAAGCFTSQSDEIIRQAVEGVGINSGGTVTVSTAPVRTGYAQTVELTIDYRKPGSRFWFVDVPGVSATTGVAVPSLAAPGTPGEGETCVQPQGTYSFQASPTGNGSGGSGGKENAVPGRDCLAASWGGRCASGG